MCCGVRAETLTCRPLGEVETVCMVNLRTSRSLTGNHLSSVSTAEALVLSLFGHHHLVLLLAVASPPQLPTFVVRRRVVLKGTQSFYELIFHLLLLLLQSVKFLCLNMTSTLMNCFTKRGVFNFLSPPSPLAWRPGSHCNSMLHIYTPSSRSLNTPGCSWTSALCLNPDAQTLS